ncbi:MAG: flavin reductase family protein [Candidatus Pelagadaptatus aseana]|uniref:flavin reductase family protein n=1 Tax=Candidatus Pelagadaptatus aseana TaxID=3120508 RepID=UPI0039B18828
MKQVELGEAMKEGMRRLASGVSVVACLDDDRQPCAMTATSITSVSDSPASLLVCINQQTLMYKTLKAEKPRSFSVNLLAAQHEEVSNRCASGDQGASRMSVGDWNLDGVAPVLEDGLASFICQVDQWVDYGTHGIVIAQIETVLVNEESDIDPLLYLNGSYGHFSTK